MKVITSSLVGVLAVGMASCNRSKRSDSTSDAHHRQVTFGVSVDGASDRSSSLLEAAFAAESGVILVIPSGDLQPFEVAVNFSANHANVSFERDANAPADTTYTSIIKALTVSQAGATHNLATAATDLNAGAWAVSQRILLTSSEKRLVATVTQQTGVISANSIGSLKASFTSYSADSRTARVETPSNSISAGVDLVLNAAPSIDVATDGVSYDATTQVLTVAATCTNAALDDANAPASFSNIVCDVEWSPFPYLFALAGLDGGLLLAVAPAEYDVSLDPNGFKSCMLSDGLAQELRDGVSVGVSSIGANGCEATSVSYKATYQNFDDLSGHANFKIEISGVTSDKTLIFAYDNEASAGAKVINVTLP